MKKLLASLPIIAAVYCGAAYLSGYFGEKIWNEQMALAQAQPQAARMNLKTIEYRRGIFSSSIVASATLPDELPGIGKPDMIVESTVRHGPLLFAKGLAIGPFASVSTIRIKTDQPDIDKKITDVFGPSIGRITTVAYFNQGYDLSWDLPAFEHQDATARFSMTDSSLDCEGNYLDLRSACKVALGRIEVNSTNGAKIVVAPIAGNIISKSTEAGVALNDIDLTLDEVDVRGPDRPPVLLKGMVLKQTQTLAGGNIDSSQTWSLAKFSGPFTLENLYYVVDLNGVNKAAMKRLSAYGDDLPANPEAQAAHFAAFMKDLAPALLQDGLMFKLDIGAQYLGAHPQAQWLVQYKAPADGRDVRAINDPIDYLQLADSTLVARLPVSLIPEPMVAPYLDSHITRDGNDYVLRATLKNGILTIGRTPIPRETLMAFFAKNDQQQPQAEPAQRKPVRKRAP